MTAVYSIKQLVELKNSPLVATPEFKWNDFDKSFRESGRTYSQLHHSRPELAREEPSHKKIEFDEEEVEADPDKAMAAFFARGQIKSSSQQAPAPAVTKKVESESTAVFEDDGDDGGWTTVESAPRQRKKSMDRWNRGSFSRWRKNSDAHS